MFSHFPIFDAKDLESKDRHSVACWGDELKHALMGSSNGQADRDEVTFSNNIVNSDLKIGKRNVQSNQPRLLLGGIEWHVVGAVAETYRL